MTRVRRQGSAAVPILVHLTAHLPEDGRPGLRDGGYQLPDEGSTLPGQVRWAPGALAGVLGHHTTSLEPAAHPGLLALVRRARRRALRAQARQQLYAAAAREDGAPGAVDALLHQLQEDHDSDPTAAARDLATARWLVTLGRHRGPVHLGIAMMGLGHEEVDREVLLVLARHDEFSRTVLRTLAGTSRDVTDAVFQVAQRATGWGRIEAIDRMARERLTPEMRRWLVCGGFWSIVPEYNAIDAARAGMLGQLHAAQDDPELVSWATRLLLVLVEARVDGGPSADILAYEQAVESLLLVFDLLGRHDWPLHGFLLARCTRTWLSLPDGDDSECWTPEDARRVPGAARARLLDRASQVMLEPAWQARVEAALAECATPDPHRPVDLAREAADVAHVLGVDAYPALLGVVQARGTRGPWYHAARAAGPDRIGQLVRLAGHLRDIAPADNATASAIASVLHWLPPERPDLGWDLVRAALGSPWGQERWAAYRTIASWSRARWPDETEDVLRGRLDTLTDGDELARIRTLLGQV